MGARREDAEKLTGGSPRRDWPLLVRRARDDDRDAVLAFATDTWHGWDYIPNAWPVWIGATDGAFLVGCVGEPGGFDVSGAPLTVGQVIAITRVAMASPGEAWLEGIRVDPRVRATGVAADLQVAELAWVAAQDAAIVRYATGSNNEASHRLGARDGINMLMAFHSLWWSADPDNDPDASSAFDRDVCVAATARRQALLSSLDADGWLANPADTALLWRLVDADASFNAGLRLYEPRAWAMNELTLDAFAHHVERGEVIICGKPVGKAADDWAVAVMLREQLPSEDSALRAAVLLGGVERAIELLEKVRGIAGQTMRLRLADTSPLLLDGGARFAAAGYRSPDWTMHILGRRMDPAFPIPAVDPTHVILAEPPDRIVPPRW